MLEYFTITPVASVIFVLTIITSIYAFNDRALHQRFMLNPYSVYRNKRVYTLITSGLIHADWMHLIFNMLSFYFFAFRLEAQMGHWQFAVLYVLSMVLADIPSVLKHKHDIWYNSLGASGAISAVLFSYILFDPLTKIGIFPIPVPIPALLFAVLYLIYCMYASRRGRDNINHDAHFFGAISGLIITIVLVRGIVPHFIQVLGG